MVGWRRAARFVGREQEGEEAAASEGRGYLPVIALETRGLGFGGQARARTRLSRWALMSGKMRVCSFPTPVSASASHTAQSWYRPSLYHPVDNKLHQLACSPASLLYAATAAWAPLRPPCLARRQGDTRWSCLGGSTPDAGDGHYRCHYRIHDPQRSC